MKFRTIIVVIALSCFCHAQAAGCGASAGGVQLDQSTCGNVGSPGSAPSSPTNISACNTNILTGGNYLVTQNIGSDATATCLKWNFPGTSVNLSLGGFTVTGQVDMSNTNQGSNIIYNGTINCQAGFGCLLWNTTGQIHHLTITDDAGSLGILGSIGINVLGTEALAATYRQLTIFNNTVTITTTHNANRTQAIRISGASDSQSTLRSVSTEGYNNNITCQDNASACQGFEFFVNKGDYVHNNLFNLPATCDVSVCSDPARAAIYDLSGDGEFAFNKVVVNGNRGVRQRFDTSTTIAPFMGNTPLSIHDNAFTHITATGRIAAVHIGENDHQINVTPVDITNNAFELAPAGNGVVSASATNVNVHNNTVTCYLGDCSAVGFFAETEVPSVNYGLTGTTITVSNNSVAPLTAASMPAVKVCGVPGNALYACTAAGASTTAGTICNSGTAVGNGTITIVSVCGSHVINSKPGGGRIISFVPDYQYAGY